jgi:ABC-type polysaccharide/polyol phosphate export permease
MGIMRFSIDLPVLVSGIFVWHFLSTCAGDAVNCILGNANLIKKTAFPRAVLPLAMTLANLANFILSLGVMAVYLLLVRVDIGSFGWMLVALPTQFALCLGLALIISSLNVFFRDVEHLLGVVMMAWFFMTPVIYPASMVSDAFATRPLLLNLYYLNPMAGLVAVYRAAWLSSPMPSAVQLMFSFGISWAFLVIGWVAFQKLQTRVGDEM